MYTLIWPIEHDPHRKYSDTAEIIGQEKHPENEADTSRSTYQQKLPHRFLHIVMHMQINCPGKYMQLFSHSSLEYSTLKRKDNLERGKGYQD